jgi:hypothetical protein
MNYVIASGHLIGARLPTASCWIRVGGEAARSRPPHKPPAAIANAGTIKLEPANRRNFGSHDLFVEPIADLADLGIR